MEIVFSRIALKLFLQSISTLIWHILFSSLVKAMVHRKKLNMNPSLFLMVSMEGTRSCFKVTSHKTHA